MSNAGRLGFVKSLPFNFGIFAGFCVVITFCTLFSTLLSELIPIIEWPMLILGATYILYLAFKTYRSTNEIEEAQVKNSFFTGMTFQFINPKFYIYCIISMDIYVLPHYADNIYAIVGFSFLLCFIGFACTLLWSAFGSAFKLLFAKHAKITNTIMALLLVYCAFSLLASHATSLHLKFFVMFTVVLLVGCTYISLRLVYPTSLQGWKRYLAYALCYTPLIYLPARYQVRILVELGERMPYWLEVTLFTSFILMGSLSVIATLSIVADLVLLSKWGIARLKNKKNMTLKNESTKQIPNKSRRLFLQNSLSAGIMTVGAGFVGYGVNEAMGMPAVKHILVPVSNLPTEFQGFKIVHLTDLHINRPAPVSRLEKIVQNINELNADSVVITGDLSDSDPLYIQNELEPLRHIKATNGKYFVSGNHEYYTGIDGWLKEIARLEFINLHNEHRAILRNGKRLLMCGVPDITAPRMSSHTSDPILAQQGSKDGDIKVLLAHQPQSIYEGLKVGYHVQLSGHTHGGQLFPWTYVTDLVQPYIHGLYKVENTQLYVSRGTGYWGPPLRIGAPPEIALIELVKA